MNQLDRRKVQQIMRGPAEETVVKTECFSSIITKYYISNPPPLSSSDGPEM